ncbi:hypothetical protein O181_123551 [Austropuccinia psidii MF-1]|uniref:Uncharacterized protein n=1 Tax=Austropuccinia psidii MF-1 TaxID=1389203 RepID=A0A9Q3Q3D0_9BASI|nr:hypothetical protein [Austropuccinia psidii MF-1]
MNIIMKADLQAEIFQNFISLAEKIRPQLRADGTNFNLWSKNMIVAWMTYFICDPDYSQQTTINNNIKQNLFPRLFIEHSIRNSAYKSVKLQIFSSDACQIYQALKDHFNCPSWSSVVYHANIIFKHSSDNSNNINEYAMSVTKAVQKFKSQLGKIDPEMITTLAIHCAVPSMHQLIIPAINTLMETSPNIKV